MAHKKPSLEEQIKKRLKNNQKYWDERFQQIEDSRHHIASGAIRRAQDAAKEAVDQIEKDIARWYQRLADNNGISMEEARRLLKANELKEFKWSLERYIEAGRENGVDNRWIKELENASAKFHITRLEALKMDVRNSVEQMYAQVQDATADATQRTYLDSYYRSVFEIQKGIGMGWNVAAIDRVALAKVISIPWTADRRNFSERIWGNKNQLINDLYQLLTRNILLGRPPGDAVKELAKRTGRTEGECARLIYTEAAYFGELSKKEAFEKMGVKVVRFVATLDERTSKICQSMDGKTFELKDYETGVNAPPLHPNCRSTLSPYYEELVGVGVRAARDPETGKTIFVPSDMTYSEWKKKYVKDGGEKSSLMKKVKNTK